MLGTCILCTCTCEFCDSLLCFLYSVHVLTLAYIDVVLLSFYHTQLWPTGTVKQLVLLTSVLLFQLFSLLPTPNCNTVYMLTSKKLYKTKKYKIMIENEMGQCFCKLIKCYIVNAYTCTPRQVLKPVHVFLSTSIPLCCISIHMYM